MAVGWSPSAAGSQSPLVMRLAGGSSRVLHGPDVPGPAALAAVSCWTGSGCLAVGERGPVGTQAVLAEAWDGMTWQLAGAVQPPGAATARFYGVWCRGAGDCMAVGEYPERSGREFPLAEAWTGHRWRVLIVPSPSAAVFAVLRGVWCTGPMCMTVGKYTPRSGPCTCRILAEQWNAKLLHRTALRAAFATCLAACVLTSGTAGLEDQAAFLWTGCLGAGVLVRPLGRPGPAREGFGALAGVPASAIR